MRLTALLACLVAGQPRDDKSAQELFDALQNRVREAKTVRSEYEYRSTSPASTYAVSFRLKGTDRWAADMKWLAGDEGSRSFAYSARCDGRRTGVESAHPLPARALKPETVVAQLRVGLATAVIMPAFVLEVASGVKLRRMADVGAVRDGGKAKVRDREARVLEYTVKYDWGEGNSEEETVRLTVDPARLVVLAAEGESAHEKWKLTYSAFTLDEDLPDSDFAFQTRRRLASAQAAQLARSVELFGRFTGRLPARPEDLLRRPDRLEPEIFYPPGGFASGGAWPRDPWGRPFELRVKDRRATIVSPAADGKSGGTGQDEDIAVEAPPASGQAVGAPSERLAKYYAARIQVQLLASAVRAYRDAYGELPRKATALWERQEGIDLWPEGGWVPGGRMPEDPWGQPLRMVTDKHFVRVQVNDPKTRRMGTKDLTGEEKAALEKAARPRLAEADRQAIQTLLDAACDDDLETREKAFGGIREWGPVAVPLLDERIRRARDADHRRWLGDFRPTFPDRPAAWVAELASLAVPVSAASMSPEETLDGERQASACLKTIATAEADFRSNDRDGNRINDFWTADVAGLFTIQPAPGGGSIKLIEASVAAADAAPLDDGAADGKYVGIEKFATRAPKSGYSFLAMTLDRSVKPAEPYRTDTQGEGKWGKVHNNSRFGFCAYPAEYGATGTKTFILNELNTIFWKDTGGEPVLEWPTDEELQREWKRLD